jgi:hypothetical protein
MDWGLAAVRNRLLTRPALRPLALIPGRPTNAGMKALAIIGPAIVIFGTVARATAVAHFTQES